MRLQRKRLISVGIVTAGLVIWERRLIQRSINTGPNWRESMLCWWDWKSLRLAQMSDRRPGS